MILYQVSLGKERLKVGSFLIWDKHTAGNEEG